MHCPILNDTVYFTSEGFYHLLYESNRKPRKIDERYIKLIHLRHVPTVIQWCKLVSETRQVTKKIKGKEKTAVQYELVYEVKKRLKVRVVIERIGTGKHKFHSVMPHDKKSKSVR